MVPPAHTWLDSDSFAQKWYNAVVSSYKQDAESGEQLGGTQEEQEKEKRSKVEGHLTGVSVDLEMRRHSFEANLLRRARDSILRDNGIMSRSALGETAEDGEPRSWTGRFAGLKVDDEELTPDAKILRARFAMRDGGLF